MRNTSKRTVVPARHATTALAVGRRASVLFQAGVGYAAGTVGGRSVLVLG